jgi:hypothetical protein
MPGIPSRALRERIKISATTPKNDENSYSERILGGSAQS